MEFGTFVNGGTNLPLKEGPNGQIIPDASIADVHEDNKQIVRDQVDHCVLAEEVGFDRAVFTEHHFQPTGAEFSSNPLMAQSAIAARTEQLKLLQIANIVTWHDPVRLAEQIGYLDNLSRGRCQVGIGRGYQPRENETLGQYWGGTIQDEEENRTSFEEKVDVLRAAWTSDLVSHLGQFHSVPPQYTRWHHPQDRAYLADDVTEQDVEEMLDWVDPEDDDWDSSMVQEGETTLESVAVFPQPYQEPHPIMWQPVTSPRSIRYAARNGINAYCTTGLNKFVKQTADLYYETLEDAGWPDHRPDYDGEPFAYGWDEHRQRGIGLRRFYFNTETAEAADLFERWNQGVKNRWQFYGPFGFPVAVAYDDEDPWDLLPQIDGKLLADRDIAFVGTGDEIVDAIATQMEDLGLDNVGLELSFEVPGITTDEANAQLEGFAEDVMPYLREQFPGA